MKYFLIILILIMKLNASQSVIFDDLEWQDNKSSKKIKRTWKGAKRYCKRLTLLGKEDWRLPTVKELQNIVNIRRKKPSINPAFHFTKHKNYWTSTPFINKNREAWTINFYRGYTQKKEISMKEYVRCTRKY